MNILIVDDENTSRMAMDAIFAKYGKCQPFATGELALEAYTAMLAEGEKFDLIILDISLENESGVDVLKKIRDLEKNTETDKEHRAVIFMATGNQDVEIVKECIKEGCNDYILKPLKPAVLAPKMEKFNFKLLEE